MQKYQLLEKKLKAEQFILEQISTLNKVRTAKECKDSLCALLKALGEFLNGDRTYIVDRIDDKHYVFSNMYQWCREGVKLQIDKMRNLIQDDMPYWIPVFENEGCIFIKDLESIKDRMPVEYKILKEQDINTLVAFPIFSYNRLQGYVAVDNPDMETAEIIERLLPTLGSCVGILRDNLHAYGELDYQLNFDELTNTYNRHGFYINAEKLIKRNKDTEYCLILSDIKSFKLVNEIYGESVADQILVDESRMLKEYMGENAVLGRLGGDVLVAVMEEDKLSEIEFKKIVEKIRNKYSSKNFRLHIYLGVYYIHDREESIRQMVDKTILSITKIKGNMHEYIAYYDEKDYKDEIMKQQLVGEFETALSEKQFCMYLQPQTDRHGNMLGAEALIRWNHPNMGLIMPGAFIGYLEDAGLIYKLDRYIWELAAMQLKKWKEDGYQYYISVNISAKDFYHIDVYETFADIVKKYDIDPGKLHIEITETALSEDEQATHKAIDKLHKEGFIIEIDDFGSGYSSFNFMKNVCADVIKIDRVFLKESSNETRGEQILQSIISLSHEIGMDVITEGVENIDQLSMLADMNCDWFQGFYFSKPIPVEEFEKKYVMI